MSAERPSVRAVKAGVWILLLCAAGFGTIVRRSGTHCGGLGGQGIVVGLGIGALLAFTVVQQPRSPEISGPGTRLVTGLARRDLRPVRRASSHCRPGA